MAPGSPPDPAEAPRWRAARPPVLACLWRARPTPRPTPARSRRSIRPSSCPSRSRMRLRPRAPLRLRQQQGATGGSLRRSRERADRATFSFALMPEHLAVTPDGSRLFAALLTQPHNPQRFEGLEGYVASFDLAQRVKDREVGSPKTLSTSPQPRMGSSSKPRLGPVGKPACFRCGDRRAARLHQRRVPARPPRAPPGRVHRVHPGALVPGVVLSFDLGAPAP